MGGINIPGFQTKALVVTPISGDNLDLFHSIYGCLGILFFAKENRFLMLFQTCTKLTFGLSDILVITVIARSKMNSVGSLFFRNRILRFGKNIPQSLKRFLSNFNV